VALGRLAVLKFDTPTQRLRQKSKSARATITMEEMGDFLDERRLWKNWRLAGDLIHIIVNFRFAWNEKV
jgi:hypothetical protein